VKYYNRKTGAPLAAVQYTGPKSIAMIENELCCNVVEIAPGVITADWTRIERGQYAVVALCAIVAMDQETFNRRFTKNELELDIFEEAL